MQIKIKIIFFLPNLLGGGAERVAVNILRQLDYDIFEVTLILVDKIGELLELVPKSVKIIDLKSKKTMFSILKLRKEIKSTKPDIVFSTLFRTSIAIDLALLGIRKKPKIIFRSSNSPKLLLEFKQFSFFNRKLLERAYRNSNLIIAQTPEMKDEIIKYHKITPKKIIVILNPIDSELIENSIQKNNNPFDTNYINAVAAGRLTYQKGFDILIKSFKLVIKNNDKFRLYLIGSDNGEKKYLKEIIRDLNLEKNIFFLGFQKNPYNYFYHSDLYILSSRWEGLPNTVLENLYLEKPIISTNCIPFLLEIIKDKKNGLIYDVDDIESLSKSILNYKTINTKYKTINFNKNEIQETFIKILNKETCE